MRLAALAAALVAAVVVPGGRSRHRPRGRRAAGRARRVARHRLLARPVAVRRRCARARRHRRRLRRGLGRHDRPPRRDPARHPRGRRRDAPRPDRSRPRASVGAGDHAASQRGGRAGCARRRPRRHRHCPVCGAPDLRRCGLRRDRRRHPVPGDRSVACAWCRLRGRARGRPRSRARAQGAVPAALARAFARAAADRVDPPARCARGAVRRVRRRAGHRSLRRARPCPAHHRADLRGVRAVGVLAAARHRRADAGRDRGGACGSRIRRAAHTA